MAKEQYRPTAKTIVTEIRHFVVDAVRRISAGRQSAATEILDATLNQLDIVVTKDNSYTLKDIRHTLSVSSPSPVVLEFTAFGEISEAEPRAEQRFSQSKVSVDHVIAGSFIKVKLEDADVFGPSVIVEAYNIRTGETEYITLRCVNTQTGLYIGYIQSSNNTDTGVNFDGTMFCAKDDTLRITYVDAFNSEGYSENISVEVLVSSNIKETEFLYNAAVMQDRPLKIAIYNPASPLIDFVSVLNVNTGSSRDIPLIETNGAFLGTLDLSFEDSPSELGVTIGDTLRLSYAGAIDSTGLLKSIEVETAVIDSATDLGEITVNPNVKLNSTISIELKDFDLPTDQATVFVNNARTSLSIPVTLNEVWTSIGIYRGSLFIGPEIALPGDVLNVVYSDYTTGTNLISSNVSVLSQFSDVIEEPEEEVDTGISKPVEIVSNGLFVFNGQFAGTVKISAKNDEEVRCSIIKA